MNLSCIVGFVIYTTSITNTAMKMILQHLILMRGIPPDMIQIKAIWILFKISPSHCFEQYPQHHHQQITISTVPQSGKARGQVTVAWIVKAIMQNHCCFRWKQYSPPVKADFLREFSSLQQHPMLPSAYLKEPTPQSSAGFISCFSLYHTSRNNLPLQQRFS